MVNTGKYGPDKTPYLDNLYSIRFYYNAISRVVLYEIAGYTMLMIQIISICAPVVTTAQIHLLELGIWQFAGFKSYSQNSG